MERTFNTLAELQAQISLLKVNQFHREEAIKQKFSTPSAIFSTIKSVFKGDPNKPQHSVFTDFLSQDLITGIARLALPVLMNSFLFKRSGLITKAIVAFVSQKAAKNVNSNMLTDAIEKVKGVFNKKKENAVVADYGIPPDSETF